MEEELLLFGMKEPMNRLRRMVKKKNRKKLIETIKAGSLKIKMHGEKMKGEYALVKLKMQK